VVSDAGGVEELVTWVPPVPAVNHPVKMNPGRVNVVVVGIVNEPLPEV